MAAGAPITTCEWMFDDAATGLLGSHKLAKFNPLRWSGTQSFDVAIFQLEVVREFQNDRPISLKAPANRGKPMRFPTTQQAINFLKRCEQVHDAQKAKALKATIKRACSSGNKCIGTHTEYEIDVCEGIQQWTVQRRYSRFNGLHAKLKAVPGFQCPELPPKGMFGFRHASNLGDFNQRRQDMLDKYLCEIVSQTACLSDVPALGEFLCVPKSAGAEVEAPKVGAFNKIGPYLTSGLRNEIGPYLPIFMLPWHGSGNGIIEVAFGDSEDVPNGVEVTIVFKDEDRPSHVEDVIYDIMRKPLFGRSVDIETFTFVTDAIAFNGTYSGNQDWSCKAPLRMSRTVNLSEFQKVTGRDGSRTVLWVNVWDHLFGPKNNNPDMEHSRIEDYPCTRGTRKEVDNRYRGVA